jgi:hypothetical protein
VARAPNLERVSTEGSVRQLGGTVERLATGVNEAGLAVGCYKDSWLPDHPLAWDAAGDAVTDLNDGISEDAGWTVFEAWGVKAPARSLALGPRWSSASTISAAIFWRCSVSGADGGGGTS